MLRNLALERPLAILDLETTGLEPKEARIVEISILKLMPDGSAETRTRRVNPGVPIPAGATETHHITDADVADCPRFERIAQGVVEFLDGCDLCGFNLRRYDLKVLCAELKRAGLDLPICDRAVIDTLAIYHEREKRDLAAALRFYCGREHEGAHAAEADVLATLEILDAQLERYGDLPRTVAGLHDHLREPGSVDFEGKFLRRPDGVTVFNFSDHKGKPVDEVARVNPGFLRWMLGKDFMDDAKLVATEALARAGEATSRAYTS
jgi:DNA polymerase III subunit epsilon